MIVKPSIEIAGHLKSKRSKLSLVVRVIVKHTSTKYRFMNGLCNESFNDMSVLCSLLCDVRYFALKLSCLLTMHVKILLHSTIKTPKGMLARARK
jgi:hypothetical protein